MMIMKNVFNDRMLNINTSVEHSEEEIELYKHLSLALELMKNDSFTFEDSGLGNNIWFSITTQYPDGLPENVGMMFFNVSTDYKVEVKELQINTKDNKRHFHISLKKV
jgi:hypothetical protein